MLEQFTSIGIFIFVGLGFAVSSLLVAWIVRPKRPNPLKMSTYECGLETRGRTWIQFKVSYFLYALVFLVFDVEVVFLIPWAVEFLKLPWIAFIEMFIFIGILVVGLWYVWKEGALEWK